MVFNDVKISRPQGDLIRVKELEVSLSLLSFFKLQPVIRTLAFRQPEIFLRQDIDGSWNVDKLLKKRPPPPFSQIHLSGIRIQKGFIEVNRPQQHQTFQDIEAQLNLTVQAPGRPQLSVLVHQGLIGLTLPPYPRLQADLALTFSPREIEFKKTALSLADIPVLNLQGKISDLAAAPDLALDFNIPVLSGPQLHQLWPGWPQTLPVQAGIKVRGPLEKMQITGTGALQDCQGKVTGSWERSAAAPSGFSLFLDFRNLNGKILSACQLRPDVADALTPLNGTLTVTGVGQPWPIDNLQTRLELEPFSYRQAKIESAALTSKLVRERLQNLVLKLQGNFGRLEAEANGQLLQLIGPRTGTAGEVKLAANGLNPALLLGAKAPPGSLDVKFSGDFQLPPTFTWNQARLSGKVVASGKLREYNFQELSAQGSWEAGELRLNPARLIMNNLRAEVQGRVSPDNADMKLALDLLSPGPWPLLPSDFKGSITGRRHCERTLAVIGLSGKFSGKIPVLATPERGLAPGSDCRYCLQGHLSHFQLRYPGAKLDHSRGPFRSNQGNWPNPGCQPGL